jgi:site-specific DNA-methyltransferase (adenine-specific)
LPYNEHTLKYPNHPQAGSTQFDKTGYTWVPNPLGAKPKDVIDIPTISNGMSEKTKHPTQKPEELIRKIILASSNIGDLIVDPFCGSGTTPVCAEQLNRKWLSCDLSEEYLNWSIERIISIDKDWDIEKWINYDNINYKRRKSAK